jgi:hypothetical protein
MQSNSKDLLEIIKEKYKPPEKVEIRINSSKCKVGILVLG